MNKLEFMKFDKVLGEKYVGIATIRYEKRFIFRFKIQPKEGGGYWAQPASFKVAKDGKDSYVPCFQLDSSYESDEMKEFVVQNSIRVLEAPQPQEARSVFENPAPSAPLTGGFDNDNLPF